MIKLRNLILMQLTLLGLIIICSQVNAMTFERGDALFCNGPVILGKDVEHAMVYWKWDRSGDPSGLSCQRLIEAAGFNQKSRDIELSSKSSFRNNSTYTMGSPSASQRNAIVTRAEQLLDKDYPTPLEFVFKYKGPEKWRCDGLLEDAYETANLDIIPGDTGATLTPIGQREAMHSSAGIGPIIQITNPSPNGIVNDNVDIKATASDVSGLARIEFWDGSPASGQQIASQNIETNGSESSLYSQSYNITDKSGTHVLYVKAYDGAGNFTVSSAVPITVMSPPGITSINPSDGSMGVPLLPIITVVFSSNMQPTSINVSSVKLFSFADGSQVAGTINYEQTTKTMTFTPIVALSAMTKYKLIINDTVKDLAGYAINGDKDNKAGGQFISYFTTGINTNATLLQIKATQIDDISGNNNQIINTGEAIKLSIELLNISSVEIANVSGVLSTDSSGISLTNQTQSFGTVASGASATNTDKYIFTVPVSFAGNEISFNLAVSGQVGGANYSNNITFKLPVGSVSLSPPGQPGAISPLRAMEYLMLMPLTIS